MGPMLKVECVNCGGKYHVIAGDINLQLPKDIEPGEAFPNECPLCEDKSNHCGIFRDSLSFHCWKCGREGNLAYLLAVITRRPKEVCQNEIENSISSFEEDSESQIRAIFAEKGVGQNSSQATIPKIKLPEYFVPVEDDKAYASLKPYLECRNLDLQILMIL